MKIDIDYIEKAINSWVESFEAPSTISSYIFKFKGSLINKVIQAIHKQEIDEIKSREVLQKIVDTNRKVLRGYTLGKSIPKECFEKLLKEIEISILTLPE
jgi:hypothetical protein